MSPRPPLGEEGGGEARRRPGRGPGTVEQRRQSRACAEPEEPAEAHLRAEPEELSFRFDDPYWDDAFDSYHDPTLRICCRI